MLKVGITGGIGSGKSTVAYIFAQLGVPCFFADDQAKLAYLNPNIKKRVIQLFGENAYVDSLPNKPFIAQQVFSNKSLLESLNNIIHPFVATQFSDFCLTHSNHPYVLKEAAILFESNSYKALDYSILVIASENVRLKRVVKRDKLSESEVLLRMNKQWSDEEKAKFADFLIYNNDSDLIIPQVLELHKKLSELAVIGQ